jgi:hypothetical protein
MARYTASRGLPQTLVTLDSAYRNLGEVLRGSDWAGGLSVGVYNTREGEVIRGVQVADGSEQRGDGSDQSEM